MELRGGIPNILCLSFYISHQESHLASVVYHLSEDPLHLILSIEGGGKYIR